MRTELSRPCVYEQGIVQSRPKDESCQVLPLVFDFFWKVGVGVSWQAGTGFVGL